MIMNRWRVGSLSMGLVLLATGIMMLASLIVQVNVMNIILTFWPVILICLGIEILLHLFVKKDGGADVKLKYDALSIIFISFLMILSVFFYAVSFTLSIFDSKEELYIAFGLRNEDVYKESDMELTDANELVVFSGFNSIKVIATSNENIRVHYTVSVRSSDKEYGESFIDKIVTFEQSERAYMLSNSALYNNSRVSYPSINCVIYLPKNKTVDLSQCNGRVEYDRAIEDQIIRQDY